MIHDEGSDNTTRVIQINELEGRSPSGDACLVVIYGPHLGKRIPLTGKQSMLIGRDKELDVTIPEDAVSRRHAMLKISDDTVSIQDLGSTNGTYVNDEPVESAVLRHGDLLKIGGTIFKYLVSGNVESAYFEEIYRMTIVDGLTEIHNRRYLLDAMEKELSRARRHGRPLSLAMFDIDHFKKVNDNYGHLTGDYVLRELAQTVKKRVRREEVFARYGGEEFVILLPETELGSALVFAEQLRVLVERHRFTFEGRTLKVTISVGVAQLTPSMTDPEDLIKAADEKLYLAKSRGRNRVEG